MPRSVKKGPFIDEKLLLSIQVMNARKKKVEGEMKKIL